ncbi:hypothetical protein [Leuconostoc fallax]|uniref:Uncharacterized protein n=1 Tax=Leuconostoc fallax TaxID=1251 RepID=A0A4R5N759_9LACO|nr:hypothetical protein [Leuconostoc fallax]MBU7455239.1 hypothetical protein [Leuconostoc fallax]MCO6183493.1 hypothetical protein [Leuconostoc fallax]TDG67655.1 hypothetical protein C5L23_001454 [Leuconostoc fallax]
MILNIIYWLVIVMLVTGGCFLVFKRYKYSNIKLAWWDYLLYICVFVVWITVKIDANINFFISLVTTLAVLYLMLDKYKQNR